MIDKSEYERRFGSLRWPKGVHPITGEPLEKCERMEMSQEVHEYNAGPPERPSREIYEWDDNDEPRYVRDRTDKEYEAALKKHEKALKEWHGAQGRYRAVGCSTVTGRFSTASGAWAEGVFLGSEREENWAWTKWGGAAL